MPVRLNHDANDILDVGIGDVGLEKIAHAVDENRSGNSPLKRLGKLIRDQPEIEALLIGMALHSTEPFGKGLGITVLAAWADFGAAAKGIPRRVGPFDF